MLPSQGAVRGHARPRQPASTPPPSSIKGAKNSLKSHFIQEKEKIVKREEKRGEERGGREPGEALLHLSRGFEDHFRVSPFFFLLLLISAVVVYDIGFRHV